MRLLPTILALLLGSTAFPSCTRSNPDFEPSVDGGAGCTPGERQCSGNTTQICTPENGTPMFLNERACPEDTSCQDGICWPTGPRCGETRCPAGKVCSIFVDPERPDALGLFCIAPVGGIAGTTACTSNNQCQSGICLGRGESTFCYLSCEKERECPLASGFKCKKLNLTINGIQGQAKGCAN